MHRTTDQLAQAAAVDFARRIVPLWQAVLGPELLGVYLIGSLAHGGFSMRYSDIDMALVTEAGLSPQALDRVRAGALELSADCGPKLSVFWTDRHFCLGRFPPLDRIDYIDHAVALMERECVRPMRPALDEIGAIWSAYHLQTGKTWCGALRPPIRSNRRIAKRICGHSSTLVGSATVG